MRYRIVAVGRRARDPLVDATETYIKRISRYVSTEFLLVRDSDPSRESKQLLEKLDTRDHLVVLDRRGVQWNTERFAEHLQKIAELGAPRIVFAIGGAYGHSEPARKRADLLLALSSMTLPHRLAWTVLAEQLYRAHTYLRGERYHHGSE